MIEIAIGIFFAALDERRKKARTHQEPAPAQDHTGVANQPSRQQRGHTRGDRNPAPPAAVPPPLITP